MALNRLLEHVSQFGEERIVACCVHVVVLDRSGVEDLRRQVSLGACHQVGRSINEVPRWRAGLQVGSAPLIWRSSHLRALAEAVVVSE